MEIGVKLWCDDIHIPPLRRLLKENIINIDDYWLVITDRPIRATHIVNRYFAMAEHAN